MKINIVQKSAGSVVYSEMVEAVDYDAVLSLANQCIVQDIIPCLAPGDKIEISEIY